MKRLARTLLALVLCTSPIGFPAKGADARELSVQSASTLRSAAFQAEKLGRGLVATAATSGINDGIYLSWRLLPDEPVNNQAFDVYRNGAKIATTGRSASTTFVDAKGTNTDTYQVVKAGEGYQAGKDVAVWTNVGTGSQQNIINSYAYLDITLDRPANTTSPVAETNDDGTKTVTYQEVTYSPNDASVADLDGDGEYELIIKWEPSNARDNTGGAITSPTIYDAYDVDYSTGAATRMWRINNGLNVQSGPHHSPFMVYDLDQDGKAEFAIRTAPGSVDGTGAYVTAAGDTAEIRGADNSKTYYRGFTEVDGQQIATHGNIIDGPQYLTLFNGQTGAAIATTDYWPQRDIADWGDSYGNRSERYLASVAYLDGKTPTLIMHRGYYQVTFAAAYQYDGTTFRRIWTHSSLKDGSSVTYADGTTKTCDKTLYGQGFHNLSVADVDNDGFDEVVYGGAVLDHDGTVLMSSGRGHGDAMHVSDFDNDGSIEMFGVHEHSPDYSVDLRRYNTASQQAEDLALRPFPGSDVGRGFMDNVDDEYAQTHPDASAIFWSSAEDGAFDTKGTQIGTKANTAGYFVNFAVYWDGDLSRELLDGTKLAKYSVENGTRRFYFGNDSWFPGVSDNNSTKATPCLSADILGDWREEVIYRKSDNSGVRLFISTIPTDYRIPTLMGDRTYRLGVTWQNNGYNQPPHTGYYLGSLALAKDANGNALNYLNPATPTGTLDVSATSTQATSVSVPVQKDTYLSSDGAAHGQETSLAAGTATYVSGGSSPGLKDPTKVAYLTFDVSKYVDVSKYEISSARVRIHYQTNESKYSDLYIGQASRDDYDEATFAKADVTFRGASTTFQPHFAKASLRPIDRYQPYEFDVTDLVAVDADGVFSLYCFTGQRSVTIASKEGDTALAPTLILTLKAKDASDPLNVLATVASPHWPVAQDAEPGSETGTGGEAGGETGTGEGTGSEAGGETGSGAEEGSGGSSEGGQDPEGGSTGGSEAGGGSEGGSGSSGSSGSGGGSGGSGSESGSGQGSGSQDKPTQPDPGGAWDVTDSGIRYLYNEKPVTGWFRVKDDWFYADEDCILQCGWLADGGRWYYLDGASGVGTWENGTTVMTPGAFGRMATNWRKVDGQWFYLAETNDAERGVMRMGWVFVDGAWYYLGDTGAMWTGWTLSDGSWYLLGTDGAMQFGWRYLDGAWFLLGGDGTLQTGWVCEGPAWYYLADDGAMLVNAWTPDGHWVAEDGHWVA